VSVPGWTIGPDLEGPFNETFPTREEALAEGRACYGSQPFWLGEAVPIALPLPDLGEEMLDRADEEANGEFTFEDPIIEATPAQERELGRRLGEVFAAWCEELKFAVNGQLVDKWGVKGPERIDPAPAAAAPVAGGGL
jgi:hypothetical protein